MVTPLGNLFFDLGVNGLGSVGDTYTLVIGRENIYEELPIYNKNSKYATAFIDNNTVFGSQEETRGSMDDLLQLAEEVSNFDGPKLCLYPYCGTEDFLYQDNLHFLQQARRLSLDLTYEEESGDHQ